MRKLVCILGMLSISSSVLADEVVSVQHDGFELVHMASLSADAVAEVERRTLNANRRVKNWLAIAGPWQAEKGDNIRVLIDPETRTPKQFRRTIYVPETRLKQALASGALATRDFGIVHEMTHVLAVSAYRKDRNRFYDDGLAVYLQHRFGPASSYPTHAQDLHVATKLLAEKIGGLLPLNEADQARRVKDNFDKRRLGYLQLGSFTQFLIETYGLGSYREVYNGADTAVVFNLSMDDLEHKWQSLIYSM